MWARRHELLEAGARVSRTPLGATHPVAESAWGLLIVDVATSTRKEIELWICNDPHAWPRGRTTAGAASVASVNGRRAAEWERSYPASRPPARPTDRGSMAAFRPIGRPALPSPPRAHLRPMRAPTSRRTTRRPGTVERASRARWGRCPLPDDPHAGPDAGVHARRAHAAARAMASTGRRR